MPADYLSSKLSYGVYYVTATDIHQLSVCGRLVTCPVAYAALISGTIHSGVGQIRKAMAHTEPGNVF